jgi:hypothetical protein
LKALDAHKDSSPEKGEEKKPVFNVENDGEWEYNKDAFKKKLDKLDVEKRKIVEEEEKKK